MGFLEIFSLCVSILTVYGIVIYFFRRFLPCCIIPSISTLLNDADQCLTNAVKTGAISAMSEYRADLEILASDLARMRIESHRSPGFVQQIRLAFRRGFTYKLYSLSSQITAVKMKVELVMDERRLTLLTTPQIVVSPPLPSPPSRVRLTSHGISGSSLSGLSSDIVIPMSRIADWASQPTVPVN